MAKCSQAAVRPRPSIPSGHEFASAASTVSLGQGPLASMTSMATAKEVGTEKLAEELMHDVMHSPLPTCTTQEPEPEQEGTSEPASQDVQQQAIDLADAALRQLREASHAKAADEVEEAVKTAVQNVEEVQHQAEEIVQEVEEAKSLEDVQHQAEEAVKQIEEEVTSLEEIRHQAEEVVQKVEEEVKSLEEVKVDQAQAVVKNVGDAVAKSEKTQPPAVEEVVHLSRRVAAAFPAAVPPHLQSQASEMIPEASTNKSNGGRKRRH